MRNQSRLNLQQVNQRQDPSLLLLQQNLPQQKRAALTLTAPTLRRQPNLQSRNKQQWQPPRNLPAAVTKPASDSSEDSSSEEEEPKAAVQAPKPAAPAKTAKESSSESSSESETEARPASAQPVANGKAASTTAKTPATKTESSSSDSSSEEEASKSTTKPVKTVKTPPAAKADESSGSSDASSDEDEAPRRAATAPNTPATNGTSGKRKRDDETEVKTPKNKKEPGTPQTFPKAHKKTNVPFRRINDEQVDVDPRLQDNSFDAKRGANGDWGQKANDVLKFTKGKSFRHEKTKKKRGSYRGGAISTTVNSIRFDSD
ncbi:hypothetical protein fugu_012886 [Takifugu bimaculatus]|uniref:Srp40 C-terminal domain-containing protein n=1 Tax=Takifugu bimaculatus TaxID=433685 RepID=A0A4Z2C6Q5_9TELE|nr:hypothetical protein fugu_012886 [Takifugu bimaculatus]